MSDHSTTTPVVYKSLDFLGYPDYRVGTDGTVWRWWKFKGWKRTATGIEVNGYHRARLHKHGNSERFFIHVLVLLAFVGQRPEGAQACHNDGNPSNNLLENLRWGTPKENGEDKVRHGRSLRGEKNQKAVLTDALVLEIRRLFLTGDYSTYKLSKMFDVSQAVIYNAISGKTWPHLKPSDEESQRITEIGQKRLAKPAAKMTADKVKQIREQHKDGATYKELANKFGMSVTGIKAIIYRHVWKDVE